MVTAFLQKYLIEIVLVAVVLLVVFAVVWHSYHQGVENQAARDQPVVTSGAIGVASGEVGRKLQTGVAADVGKASGTIEKNRAKADQISHDIQSHDPHKPGHEAAEDDAAARAYITGLVLMRRQSPGQPGAGSNP